MSDCNCYDCECGEYKREQERLTLTLAIIARIREVHAPIDAVHYAGTRQTMRQVCTGCGTDDGNWQVWPCPTIRALEGDE